MDKLNLGIMQVDIKTTQPVPSQEYIGMMVDGVANIKIGSDDVSVATAAEQFLGWKQADIAAVAMQVLEGNMREIIGRMTISDLVQNRDKFAQETQRAATADMKNMGLEIVNLTIQNFSDNDGVLDTLDELDANIYLLQEVDEDSTRSYDTNEMKTFSEGRNAHSSVYALNYSCPFVPFPWPPIGKVNSGILTTSDYAVEGGSAERIALPCPFSWPLRTANLKRCLLVSRYALPEVEGELVVVNLHLEAYDDGEGKAAQTAMLFQILEEEYARGNYVIAGGDFNQTFPGTLEKWPIGEGDVWAPGVLEAESLPEGWSYVYDDSSPTCRLLDAPYDSGTSQHYVLDGFIVSPNVEVLSVQTQDLGFKYSDHNPVVMEIGFKEA